MTTLVTGATGFLGNAVTRALLNEGITLKLLKRVSSDTKTISDLDVPIINGDLQDSGSLERALRGCDTLYHVAADYRLWVKNYNELYANNVVGTENIMRAAIRAGVSKIVYTSSVATIGLMDDGSSSCEDTPSSLKDMIGHYKRSKFLAEEVVNRLVAKENLPAIIVNPSTPIGPRDPKPTPTGRIIRDAANGRMPAYIDTGLNVAHVDDVAKGHLLAHDKGQIGRRYILGGENKTLKEILDIVATYCNHPAPRLKIPRSVVYPIAFASEVWASLTNGPEPQATIDGLKMAAHKMFFSSARASEELGYSARPAKMAIQDSLEWFQKMKMIG
jgi:dihydroflavonol-4-reductase